MTSEQLHEATGWLLLQQQAQDAGLQLRKLTGGWWQLALPAAAALEVESQLRSLGVSAPDISHWTQATDRSITKLRARLPRFKALAQNPQQVQALYHSEAEAAAYADLSSLRERSQHTGPPKWQLFVPRAADLSKSDLNWLDQHTRAASAVPVQPSTVQLTESAPPVITRTLSPPGTNKPQQAFWTSSARPAYQRLGHQYYTSDWVNWLLDHQRRWWAPVGYMYTVDPTASVLPLHDSADAVWVYNIWARLHQKPVVSEYQLMSAVSDLSQHSRIMIQQFPWTWIAQRWAGVYHAGGWRSSEDFTLGWDVDSCAWFDPGVLKYRGRVLIRDPRHASES